MAGALGFSAAYAATAAAQVAKSQKVLLESLEASLAPSSAIGYAPDAVLLSPSCPSQTWKHQTSISSPIQPHSYLQMMRKEF